jgi:hypothetical protein
MNEPLVSVVMVVCNVDLFLVESIESILGQTLREFEFIIVDYGSTDKSKAIAVRYAAKDSRIRFHEIPNCVLPAARNAGCFLAQGQYIAIMDADDISLPERLSRQVEYMQRHPQVALLGAAVQWIDSVGRPFHTHRHPTDGRELKVELLTHNVFWHPTTVMRKEAFAAVGGYRHAFVCSHDYDLALRIADKYDVANLDDVVLRYRVHPIQLTSDKNLQQSLCKLAAQASEAARSKGQPDPLDSIGEITPSVLATMGVSELVQRNSVVSDGRVWVRNTIAAGDYAAALSAARRITQLDLRHVDPWQVSELYLSVAELYWRERKIWKCLVALRQAVRARPILLGRPLKALLHRLGLA